MDAKDFDRDAIADAVCRALKLHTTELFSDRRRLDCPPGVLAARAAITRIMRGRGYTYPEIGEWLGINYRLLWLADHPGKRAEADASVRPHAASVDDLIVRVLKDSPLPRK